MVELENLDVAFTAVHAASPVSQHARKEVEWLFPDGNRKRRRQVGKYRKSTTTQALSSSLIPRHYVSSKREDHKQFTEMEKDTIRSLSGLKHMMSEIEDLIVKLETESRFVSVEEFNQLSDDVQEWFFDEVDWIFSIV